MKPFKVLILFLFSSVCSFAQVQKEDIDVFNEKVQEYIYTNLDTAYYFANKALVESRNINYKKGEMQAQFQMGRVYLDRARRVLALESGKQSLTIAEEIDNYEGKKDAYNLIIKIYNHSNQIKEGMIATRKVLNLTKEEGDSIETAKAYNFMGIFKRKMGEPDSSLYYKMESMKINRKLKNEKSLAYNYTSLGIYHYDNGNIDTAFSYLRKSLQIREQLNLIPQRIEANNNIGYIFLMLEIADSAIYYFQKSIDLCLTHEKYSNLAALYINLSESYKLSGEHELALDAIEKSIPIKDSLMGIKQHKQILKIEKKKAKKLAKEIEIESEFKKKQYLLIFALIIALLISIILSRISRKKSIETALLKQKTIAAKEIIDEYEKIDEWIAQELHDNIGGSIAAIRLQMLETLDVIKEQEEEIRKKDKEIFEMDLNKLNHLVEKKSEEIEHLNEVYKNIRTLSHNLAPVSFVGGKFVSLLQEKISSRFPKSIRHSIVIEPEEELIQITDDLKFNVYRILQNLSSNIVRHSKAKNSKIKVLGGGNHLTILVEDDGIGFDPKTKHGLGLDLVQKRVLLFDGTIDIDSQINKGTTVSIIIPYQKNGSIK
ncbi:MAG: tetratricopeptide repeat protein [Flavobacteriales bacterium]|nr:tetratricopeptide repeat protein [Flavobacteriales bacterium]